jgi:hypothetical protein
MPRDGADQVADLRAMAAELERQFAGYKQRLAERNGNAHVDDESGGVGEPGDGDSGDDVMRGRMYEAYVRRRDERLRQGWRARMERKEAEVKAFWAQLEFTGRAGGSGNDERASVGDDEEVCRHSFCYVRSWTVLILVTTRCHFLAYVSLVVFNGFISF